MINIAERKRKSEKLSPDERKALKRFVESFPTVIDAAIAIGIHRNTLDIILVKGQGSPDTIGLIRGRLVSAKAA